jgi:hypothetical protein
MLPRERVLAALQHREPDRIPWGEHSIDYNVYQDILGRETFVQAKMKETQAYWDGRRDEVVASIKRDRLDLVRALEFDIVTVHGVQPVGYHPVPYDKLSEGVYRNPANGLIYHVSATTHDLMPVAMQTVTYKKITQRELEEMIAHLEEEPEGDPNDSRWEFVHHAVKEMKGTHFIMMTTGDLEWPRFGRTEEESWMNLVRHPRICAKLAELQGRRLIRQVKLYAQLGLDGIMPCGDLGSSKSLMASPKIYREMVYPWHKAHVAEAHKYGLWVLKHCCGHVWPIIDELAEVYDAYEAIQGTAGMDIKALKERVGDRLTLWGGIWHEHIILGSKEDIRNDARYAFTYGAPGGGFIMGSTHSLAVDAKAENILEMKRVRDEWGVYPIRPERFN